MINCFKKHDYILSSDIHRRIAGGSILIDVLVALSLSVLFVATITESTIMSRQIFDNTKDKDALLKMFDAGIVSSTKKLYGNNEIESGIVVASSTIDSKSLSFTQVSAGSIDGLGNIFEFGDSGADFMDVAGTPLCSVGSGKQASIVAITLPIDPLLPLTDLQVRDGVAYVTADSASASDPDLIIADIHDAAHPTIISTLNTGPGLSALAIAGRRIYAAAPSTAGQLHVIRLDSLTAPVLETKFKLSLPYATATPALGSSIFYNDGRIYLGIEKWDGDEFNVIDVSNPLAPVKTGGLEIGSKVNSIYVENGFAYIADADQFQLRMVDVRNLSHPILAGVFSSSGWQRQEGKIVSLFEHGLNLGRTSGGFNYTSDHEAFTWSSSTMAGLLSRYGSSGGTTTLAESASIDIPSGVYGIVKDRSRIYLATRQADKEFQIFDAGLTASTSLAYSLPVQPQMMTCDGGDIYILAHTAPAIYKVSL